MSDKPPDGHGAPPEFPAYPVDEAPSPFAAYQAPTASRPEPPGPEDPALTRRQPLRFKERATPSPGVVLAVIAGAILVVLAVVMVRPGPSSPPSGLQTWPTEVSLPGVLPEPDDQLAVSLRSMGFSCVTERLQPTIVGCRLGATGEDRQTLRWVLDDAGSIVTFQAVGPPGSGMAGDAFQSSAVTLLRSIDEDEGDVLAVMSELGSGASRTLDREWGSIELSQDSDLGPRITGLRSGAHLEPLQVKPFLGSAQGVVDSLVDDGTSCSAVTDTRYSCTVPDGRLGLLIEHQGSDITMINFSLDDPSGQHATVLLLAALGQDDGNHVAGVVAVNGLSAEASVTAVAGYLVEKIGGGYTINRVEGWW